MSKFKVRDCDMIALCQADDIIECSVIFEDKTSIEHRGLLYIPPPDVDDCGSILFGIKEEDHWISAEREDAWVNIDDDSDLAQIALTVFTLRGVV